MKTPSLHRARETDTFGINSQTMHQYYNTVQSDEHPEHLVNAAMSRRQAMALQAHRRDSGPGWVAMLAVAAVVACVVWLLA